MKYCVSLEIDSKHDEYKNKQILLCESKTDYVGSVVAGEADVEISNKEIFL
jgi:hypothetical protein